MERKCYKENVFVPRIEQALGVNMPPYTCHIVDQSGMTKAMSRAGWNKSQTRGVVGFHLDDKVWVLKDAPWTTLHELIHRAGVNADRINRHLAEGLTELIASELKTGPDEHRPTYPSERKWTKNFLKRMNMSALELGKFIANSKNPPEDVANLIVKKGISKKSVFQLKTSLKSQGTNTPSLNRRGSATVLEPVKRLDSLTILGIFLVGLGIAKSRMNQAGNL
jgi:hypothetical protein